MSITPISTNTSGTENFEKISDLRFQKLFEDADAMSIQGYLPDGTVVYWNRASEAIYGYSAAEALGGNLLNLIIPSDMRSIVKDAVRHMFETGQGIPPGRLNLMHKEGHVVPVYSSHTVVYIAGHLPVLFCMDIDVSALAKAEDDLRVAATIFESQQGMVITDTDGNILRVNHAFMQMTGYGVDEVLGQNPRLLASGRHDVVFYKAMWHSIVCEGNWHGEIWNRRKNGDIFPAWIDISAVKDADGQLTHYVATCTDISSRKSAEDQINYLAFYDPLTHLPNRRLLLDRLEQAIATCARHQCKGALLYVDLDNFKTLNETLGHIQGDLLLEMAAKRLLTCVRDDDTVARLGGDEFVVMIEHMNCSALDAATQAEAVGHKINEVLSQSYPIGPFEHHNTSSIGITLFGNEAIETTEEPLKRAEMAMYQAKAAGRNLLRFFDAQMQVMVTVRSALERDLREAVRQNQFILHYQAQVNISGLTGAEVLVRWQHPVRNMVSPTEFIPLAEETGLILPLGQWVLETACAQLAAWAVQPTLAHLTLAVNVSAKQFYQEDFVAQVQATLARTGANPHRLKLELTESLLVTDVESIILKMSALKSLGLSFSLDDFGTGYSSLSYLKRLPLDQLKIDQGFVKNILTDSNDAAIARMVVALAESLGLAVIAEGVETKAHQEFLAHIGCHAYQGYLFSRPIALEDFEKFVQQY